MFAVIEFSPEQGGGLSLVNKNWLTPRKKEVFWPPYKDQKQFNRSLKKIDEVLDTETWRLYNVKRIFYETDDYDDALSKLKRAEDTSDIQTDAEETGGKKRKVTKPQRLLLESSDEEEVRQVPAPPKIRRTLFVDDSNQTQKYKGVESQRRECTPPTAATTSNHFKGLESVTLPEKSAFQIILENLLEIKSQNKLIFSKLNKLVEVGEPKIIPELPVTLPIANLEQIDIVENFLQDRNHETLLVNFFRGLGGEGINSKTNRILKTALQDSLAVSYNFFGRNKKAFNNLKICSCIIDAVKSSCGCTSSEVERAIKIWLKHAPQRLKGKKNGDV